MKHLARWFTPLHCLAWLCLYCLSTPILAATFTVTSANDSGPGTLRQAMINATAATGTHTIVFSPTLDGTPIVLASPLPQITNNTTLTIVGNDPVNTIIDGDNQHQIFLCAFASNAHLTLRDMTVRNGKAVDLNGGAVDFATSAASSLNVEGVEFIDNYARYEGGAIRTQVPTHIRNSIFVGNQSMTFGGAIAAGNTPLTVINSSFAGNTSVQGIIRLDSDIAPAINGRLVNVTITGNSTHFSTIYVTQNARLSISNSLIAGNARVDGGNLGFAAGGAIIAGASHNNIIGPSPDSGLTDGVNGNQLDVTDPLVGPLGNYGGTTRTVPLLPGSPAINAGTNTGGDIPTVDQRGIARVGAPDVGAFESRGFTLARVSGNNQSTRVGEEFPNPLRVQVTANQVGEPIEGGRVTFSAPASGASATFDDDLPLLDSLGRAEATATANAVAGGPYNVTATLQNGSSSAPSTTFALTNEALPALSIADVTLEEGDSGNTAFNFVVSLDKPAGAAGVSFDIATANGTAVAPGDYTAQSLTGQSIPANTSTYSFTVLVNGDTTQEPDETFFVNVTNVTGATVLDGQGMGTIINDDDPCAGFSFPYTLAGSDNTARVAELRQAIECANANATDDIIDLSGYTLNFDTADTSEPDNALPVVTSGITLLNGTLQRDSAAADFRLVAINGAGHLIGEALAFRNGRSGAGAAIYNAGTLVLRNASFFDNGDRAQTAEGGAIFHGSSEALRIVDSVFEGNAAVSGGAVYINAGDVWLRGSLLQGNQADEGGALYSLSPTIRLFDNAFVANHALRGGAIKTFSARITATLFDGNTADERAGAVYMEAGFVDMFVSNSLFSGNQAPEGAALFAADASTHLNNVTFSGHPAGAGSLLASAGDDIIVANSIVWGNNGRSLGPATVRHSLVEGGHPGGTNIIELDPRFIDPADGDFRLASHSPAIDAGNNADVRFDTWWDVDDDGEMDEELDDLDGNPRRHDDTGVVDTGVGSAPLVDLGAYERQINSGAPGITVDPTSGLVTTEAGGTASFNVVLDTQPNADVSIDLSSSDTTEGTVSPVTLTFTPANWNSAQTVTITGIDDNEVDGDIAYTIVTAAAVSTDANYNGLDPADVSVTNTDNDSAGITVTPTSGLVITEGMGPTGTPGVDQFSVVLNSQPAADVTIALSSSDTTEGTVSASSLTFTPANWNVAQPVDVLSVDDNEVDGDITFSIVTAAAVSADPNYNGVDPADVTVTNRDNDSAGITVDPTSGLTTTEAGGTATFTVVLDTQPSADVSIGLSSSDTTEGNVAPLSLSFTPANWNTPQTVTVTGVGDNEVDGDIAYTIITAAATSADANYNGIDPADVSVTNIDNDSAGITVNPTSGLTTTEAGGTASFFVILDTQPSADVSIGLASSDTTEGNVAPASLSFTPANWNTPQTVTVTGVDDNEVDGDIAYTIITAAATSADANYNGVDPADVSVTNIDDDSAGILLAASGGSSLVTSEMGDSDTFTVVLSTLPTDDVVLAVASNDPTEGVASPTSLVFTTGNWNVPQTVTVTGVDDTQIDGDRAYRIQVGPSASADPTYDGMTVWMDAINIDDDVAGVGPPRPVPFGGVWVTLILLLSLLAMGSDALTRRR
jgi:hypothetical protein